MRFALNISCDNAAFGELPDEVSHILDVASCAILEDDMREGICRDSNGNRVGDWRFIEEGENQ